MQILNRRKGVFILHRATIVDGVLKMYTDLLMTGQKGPTKLRINYYPSKIAIKLTGEYQSIPSYSNPSGKQFSPYPSTGVSCSCLPR